jgi:two-component system nitrate/nitrite sensor histidine kinase NarX
LTAVKASALRFAHSARMPHRHLRAASLSAKLGAIGALLLVLALGSIGLTLWVTWQLEGGAAAVNEAGRLRMQTWRLAQTVGTGNAERLRQHVDQFEASLALLRQGDPARPLFVPHDARTRDAFARVQTDWATLRNTWQAGALPPVAASEGAEALVAHIDQFVSAIESQLSRWTAVLTAFQLGLMALAIAGGVTLLYAAYLFVFNPLARLQAGLERVEQGDLGARVEVDSADEFGRVAEGFNRMATTLEGFYRDLEDKVREKTEKLRAERERLSVLYDASAFIGQAASIDTLGQGFAQRMRAAGRADAVLLRWYDPAQRQHLLLAAEGVPAEMAAFEHCLDAGQCHCGQPDAQARARVIPIQAAGADGTESLCRRFGFQRVVTVPVRLHDQRLAEVDLLYRDASTPLDAKDRVLLESLAAHLASGMESLRAAALEREAAVAEERGLLARELHDSIAQSLAFLKIQMQLLQAAQRKGDAAGIDRAVHELDAGILESTADVRELLLHFRTRTNSDDIIAALKTTLQKFQHQTGLPAHLQVHGRGVPLPPDVQVQVLHVVQEALSNVRKHARATTVWVDVQQSPQWRIEVRDDGHGFDSDEPAEDETHVGLRIMRERAQGIGADVSVRSTAGEGTRVVIELPARELEAA